MKEPTLEQSMAKLLHIFNTIVDKSTGPEALSLLQSYMKYVVINQYMFVGLVVILWCVTLLLTYIGWRHYTDEVYHYKGTFIGYWIAAGVIGFINFICTTAGIPKAIAVIIDPRLYFVFKVME